MYFDFAQDNSGDLLIADGDFVSRGFGHDAHRGYYYRSSGMVEGIPQDGVGISNYSKSTGKRAAAGTRDVKLQLENDGYQVDNPIVTFIDDKLTINPNAVRI